MNEITSLQFLNKHPIWNILFDYQDIENFYICGGYIRDYILMEMVVRILMFL